MVRALLIALAVLAVSAPAASAHATLEGTSPARGATVREQPRQVVFSFNEPVEGSFGAVRVFDAQGRRVDDGRVVHPGSAGAKIAVGLRSGLAQGSYTATYRVISADGHPVSGGVIFNIGRAGVAPRESVADLIGGSKAGRATTTAFAAVKAAGYLAIALALGGLLFLWFVWAPALGVTGPGLAASAPFARRAHRLLAVAIVLGGASTAAGIVLEGATAAGTSFWGALNQTVVRGVLETHFGTMWAVRLAAWLALGAGLVVVILRRTTAPAQAPAAAPAPAPAAAPAPAPAAAPAPVAVAQREVALVGGGGARRPPAAAAQPSAPSAPRDDLAREGARTAALPGGPAGTVLLGLVALLLAVTPALAGHARTQSPVALLIPSDVVHVVAMSLWLGGLVFLLVAVPAATRALEPADRTRLLSGVLSRFSPLALIAVIALAVTGTVQAIVEVGSVGALTSTAFGRAVLIKAGLLLVLIGLGAINRQRVVPRLRRLAEERVAPGDAGRLLRRTLRGEVALILVVLGVTGALTGYAPATAETANAGPFSTSRRMGPLDLEITLDPARVGPNALHLYVFDAKDGAPFTGTKELRVKASLPSRGIGGIGLTMHRAGPGHYVADAVTLSPAGDWNLAVTDRVSDFDEYATTVKAPVR
jgi:copper transport protein